MATKYLDSNGLLYLWQKIRNTFVSDVVWDSTNKKLIRRKKTGANGTEESVDLVTFATVATSGSYEDLSNKPTIPTLKNVFGKVKVGNSTIEADTTQDTLELEAGSNVTLTADTTNDKVTIASTDTKNTAGSTDSSSKLFIVGATTQDTNPQTYSQDTAYVGTDGHLYSDSKQVVNLSGSQSLTNKTYNGYTLGAACAKGVVTSISSDSNDVPTVTAVKNYIESTVTGAVAFQGTAPTTFAPTDYKAGYYWVIGTAGTYAGQTCEAGDMIFAIADYSSAYSASDFDVVQTNLDITSISNVEIDTIVAS